MSDPLLIIGIVGLFCVGLLYIVLKVNLFFENRRNKKEIDLFIDSMPSELLSDDDKAFYKKNNPFSYKARKSDPYTY